VRIWGTLDAFLEPGPPLGRRVANRSFLRALIRHGPLDRHDFFLADDRAAAACAADLQAEFPTAWADGALVVRTVDELARGLAAESYHCFHLANCVLFQPHLAALRNRVAPTLFPITGVTHSLSYARDLPRWLAHLSADTTARDAIVATSSTGAAALRAIFATLAARYVIVGAVTPRIAQLPLGLELGDFPAITSAQRTAQRVDLGFAPDDVVVLGFGRIAHASKMDLLPLFAACARLPAAARATLVVVIAGGLDAGDRTPELLEAMAAAGEVRLRVATNPTDAARIALYGSADVFVSPIDNPQETFGLTVIEAAAMGLPVIASDYDGYRDLVVDGETGFLIPTLGPATTDDTDALANLLFDDQYHLRLAQQTVVDVGALARALATLIGDPARRRAMGEAGRRAARVRFAWPTIIRGYHALWDELRAEPAPRPPGPHPLHLPYAAVFAGYPTAIVDGELTVVATARGSALLAGTTAPIIYGSLDRDVDEPTLRTIVAQAEAPVRVDALIAGLGATRRAEAAQFVILWALKHDFLQITNELRSRLR